MGRKNDAMCCGGRKSETNRNKNAPKMFWYNLIMKLQSDVWKPTIVPFLQNYF
jgi:hypothetical protein